MIHNKSSLSEFCAPSYSPYSASHTTRTGSMSLVDLIRDLRGLLKSSDKQQLKSQSIADHTSSSHNAEHIAPVDASAGVKMQIFSPIALLPIITAITLSSVCRATVAPLPYPMIFDMEFDDDYRRNWGSSLEESEDSNDAHEQDVWDIENAHRGYVPAESFLFKSRPMELKTVKREYEETKPVITNPVRVQLSKPMVALRAAPEAPEAGGYINQDHRVLYEGNVRPSDPLFARKVPTKKSFYNHQ